MERENLMFETEFRTFLRRPQFLERLRIEKRRVDRSKAPMSLALFYLDGHGTATNDTVRNLLTLLMTRTRETDIKGWVERDVIGVILPDTDRGGVRRCLHKIVNGNGNGGYSFLTATYPDQLFENILGNESEGVPDLFPLDLGNPVRSRGIELIGKRIVDVTGAVVLLLVLWPLMIMTAAVIKCSSAGPIIFRQTRLGKGGSRFPFLKFRSMYVNDNEDIHREYVTNLIKGDMNAVNQGDSQNPFYKIKKDPRVTAIGKIIRKTSIDELPQLFNVLKGEMSLVGPRPPLPYEVEKYKPWHLRRILEVTPGITGLWQVDGRSKTSFDDMVRLDLRYAQHWSLWGDFKILLKTVRAVIRPTGAV